MFVKYLAISGKLKHGKDTLAQFILNHIRDLDPNICITKIAFADPIKKIAKIMYPVLNDDDLWGPSQNREKEIKGYINPENGNPLIVRDVLTHIGSWGRKTNEDCWVISTFKIIDDIIVKNINKKHLILVSDCRFKNELQKLESKRGYTIRVIRPSVGFTTNDVSETDLDNEPLNRYSYSVNNDKGLDYLFDQAGIIAKKVIK